MFHLHPLARSCRVAWCLASNSISQRENGILTRCVMHLKVFRRQSCQAFAIEIMVSWSYPSYPFGVRSLDPLSWHAMILLAEVTAASQTFHKQSHRHHALESKCGSISQSPRLHSSCSASRDLLGTRTETLQEVHCDSSTMLR